MRRPLIIFAALAFMSTMFAVTASHAADVIDIQISGQVGLNPSVTLASPGDTVRFVFLPGGAHQIQSYAGVGHLNPDNTRGSATVIDSGLVNAAEGAKITKTITFRGGTVRFRDVAQNHSKYPDEETGLCNGLCGVITESSTTPLAPVIDAPTRTIEESPATITGTAEPLTFVSVAIGTDYDSSSDPQGLSLTDKNGIWRVQTVQFGALSGDFPIVARAIWETTHVSPSSAAVVFRYLPDTVDPQVSFDDMLLPTSLDGIMGGEYHLTGKASDNVNVRALAIVFTRQDVTADVNRLNPEIRVTFPVQCVPECPAGKNPAIVTFDLKVEKVEGELVVGAQRLPSPGGVYTVSVIAIDTSNRRAGATLGTPQGKYLFVDMKNTPLPAQVRSMAPTAVPTSIPTVIPT